MEEEVNAVTINGVKYVRADSVTGTPVVPVVVENYCIVRSRDSGVFAGEIVAKNG